MLYLWFRPMCVDRVHWKFYVFNATSIGHWCQLYHSVKRHMQIRKFLCKVPKDYVALLKEKFNFNTNLQVCRESMLEDIAEQLDETPPTRCLVVLVPL